MDLRHAYRLALVLGLLGPAACSDPTAILVHIYGSNANPPIQVPDDINRLVVSVSANRIRVAHKDVLLSGPARALDESLTLVPGSQTRGGILILVEGFQGAYRMAATALVTEFSSGEIVERTIWLDWLAGECQDADGDGYGEGRGCLGGDCDDLNTAVNGGAVERCNQVDDDCDGATDEPFDLSSDPQHCGDCNHACDFKNGGGECQDGRCVLTGCMGGYLDANRIPDDGCECSPSVPPDEVCDGLDNDCNGVVDDDLPDCTAGVCLPDRWCWENPLPQGNQLQAVWGSAADDVWAVGALGVILHWDGTGWKGSDSGTSRQLNGVWGSGADDVWAVGVLGTILHYTGGAWANVTSGTTYDLLDLWGWGADDVWAVGDPGTPGGVSHYFGGSWSRESFPGTEWMQGVWGAASSDVWTVGSWGKIHRYTGGGWQEYPSGLGGNDDLFGVWGSGPGDVWAVGANYFENQAILTRFNGTSWTPQSSTLATRLQDVFGFTANDAWAVGDSGTVLRWQGGTWTSAASGTDADLLSVWGAEPNDVWAVGQWGTILHRVGATWTSASQGTTVVLNEVWAADAQNAWAVGEAGTILKRDKGPWKAEPSGLVTGLNAVWGSGSGDVWAVGDAGAILRRSDAGAWARGGSFTSEDLNGIWGSGETDVWAVGNLGSVGHYYGTSWSALSNTTTKNLYAVWVADTDTAWAVGSDGTILAYTGTWSVQTSGTPNHLYGVRGLSATDVWAVGASGTILHSNGSGWSDSAQGAWGQYDFYAVYPAAADQVWVAGQARQTGGGGVLLKYNGGRWSQTTYGAANALRGIWGTAAYGIWVAGEGGAILRFSGD